MYTIDFKKLAATIPEGGELVLKLTQKGKELQLIYAPKGKKLKDDALPPLLLKGTAQELTEAFETVMSDVLPLERMATNAEKIAERKNKVTATVKPEKKATGKGDEEEGGLFAKSDKKKEKKPPRKGKAATIKKTPPAGVNCGGCSGDEEGTDCTTCDSAQKENKGKEGTDG